LGKSKTRAKRSYIRCLKARETRAISLENLASMALEIGLRDLTNRVKTSFTLVGNSADSRRLADVTPCIATPNAGAHLLPEAGAERTLEAVRCSAWLGGLLGSLSLAALTVQAPAVACYYASPKNASICS
jgi:hypothetical protein